MQTRTAGPTFNADILRRQWIQVPADEPGTLAEVSRNTGANFADTAGRVWETDEFVYLPVMVNLHSGETITRETVVFALAPDKLVTLQPTRHFSAFDKALSRIRRTPELASTPHGVMYALLYALNEVSEQVIDHASDALEAMNDEIAQATAGHDHRGKEIGVSDMQDTTARMNGAEEIVSRCQESQLLLARAARHLRAEIGSDQPHLAGLTDILIADIDGVKEHASYEHDKVRYLQQSIMTSLNVKQNQIVKVFTIITAVFLPPTLIATFYGMNFTEMPELSWTHGFLITTTLTFVAALIPLWYIKHKGWLR